MLLFAFFFAGACLIVLGGILALVIVRPRPDNWLLRPVWGGLGLLQCCAIPVVGIVMVGLPIFWLAGVDEKGTAGLAAAAGIIFLIIVMMGSYAAFVLTNRRHRLLLWIASGALAGMVALAILLGKQ